MWIYTSPCSLWRLERMFSTLELGLQMLVSCLMWVPGPELMSSAIAVRTLTAEPTRGLLWQVGVSSKEHKISSSAPPLVPGSNWVCGWDNREG